MQRIQRIKIANKEIIGKNAITAKFQRNQKVQEKSKTANKAKNSKSSKLKTNQRMQKYSKNAKLQKVQGK